MWLDGLPVISFGVQCEFCSWEWVECLVLCQSDWHWACFIFEWSRMVSSFVKAVFGFLFDDKVWKVMLMLSECEISVFSGAHRMLLLRCNHLETCLYCHVMLLLRWNCVLPLSWMDCIHSKLWSLHQGIGTWTEGWLGWWAEEGLFDLASSTQKTLNKWNLLQLQNTVCQFWD